MSDGTNLIALVLGISATLIGILLTIKAILIIKANEIITGIIVDRTSDKNEHYVPVIEYEENKTTKYYTSIHYSIVQRIGGKIKIINSKKENRILGTLGALFFKPLILMISGLFIIMIILLYELSI